LLRSVLIHPGL